MTDQRYNRQVLLPFIGEDGQRRIGASTAVVIGCGALGTVSANLLARAGVGRLRIVDRDFVEESNLQRQVLFDEQDVRDALPKAAAAERRLRAINGSIAVEGVVADVHAANCEELVRGATVVLDGTDNFETRFLINDACVKLGIPWVYGGAVGSTGMCMTVWPGETPCLRCVFETAPPPGVSPTCDTAGVLASAAGVIGSFQAAEALKVCAGRSDGINRRLFSIDLWTGEVRLLNIARAQGGECPCCGRRSFEYLEGRAVSITTRLCGRDAVQITPPAAGQVDLAGLDARLSSAAGVTVLARNRYLLRFSAALPERPREQLEVTVFPDGRALVKGAQQPAAARAIYAKYVGA